MKHNFFKLFIGLLSVLVLLIVLVLFGALPGLTSTPVPQALLLPEGGDIDATVGSTLALAAVERQIEAQHDNYAIYYTPEEFDELYRSIVGSYSGIGIYISPDNETGRVLVYSVFRNGPAYNAGLQPGDVFLQLNGQDLDGMDYEEVARLLTSYPRGTHLQLLVERPEQGQLELEVVTDEVDIPTLDYAMLDEQVGLIKIESFNSITGNQFADAFADLQEEGMQALVLDLRDNGGGEVQAALQVSDFFVPKGEALMYITDSQGVYQYTATTPAVEIPLVILQNDYSASSSEILIGAVHDNEAGITIGETTFGKGIVQDLHRLDSGAGLRFTSSKYTTSHNHDIHGCGIEPDIYFPMPEEAGPMMAYTMDVEQDPQLAKALAVAHEQMTAE